MRELNRLYTTTPALYEIEDSWEGFTWLVVDDAEQSTIAFARMGHKNDEMLVCAFNFTPVEREAYRLPVPKPGKYKEILNSDAFCYGGTGVTNPRVKTAKAKPYKDCAYSIEIRLPPLSAVYFRYTPVPPRRRRPKRREQSPLQKRKAKSRQNSPRAEEQTLSFPHRHTRTLLAGAGGAP